MNGEQRVLVVEARFHKEIADQMAQGAIAALEERGVPYVRYWVPGTFEVPAAIALAIQSQCVSTELGPLAGIVALGCVIRGETDHYEHICRETCHALMNLAVTERIALGFGILTCHSYEQAQVRAAVTGKNKGAEAARACLRMMELKQTFGVPAE